MTAGDGLPRGFDAVIRDDDLAELRDSLQREVLDAFGLEPWQIGLAPVPRPRWRRITAPAKRAWLKITRQW